MVASVADRAGQITSKNSLLMKRAKTQGMQQAGRRGLGNSTMGIQAAQAAVIDAATPMAQTDAQLDNQRLMQTRDFGQRDKEQERSLGLEERKFDESRRQFDAGFGEQQRQFNQGFGLDQQRFGEQQRQFNQGFGLDQQRFQEQQRQFNQGLSLDQQRFDEDARRFNEGMGLDIARFNEQVLQSDRQQTNTQMQAFQNIESNYTAAVSNIQQSDMPREARDQALQHAREIRDSNIALMQQMYPNLAGLDWGEINTQGEQGGNDNSGNAGQAGNRDGLLPPTQSPIQPLGDGPAPGWLPELQTLYMKADNGDLRGFSEIYRFNELTEAYQQYQRDYENYEI